MTEYLISADDLMRLASLAVTLDQDNETAREVLEIIQRTPIANEPHGQSGSATEADAWNDAMSASPPAKPE